MIAKQFIKSTVISARPNWLRSIDKRGNTIQSLSTSNRDWIIQSSVEAGIQVEVVTCIGDPPFYLEATGQCHYETLRF